MANPNALFLLADHIKLSLVERQRSRTLDLLQDNGNSNANANDSQDGHISRSLDQFRDGLDALRKEQARLEGEDNGKAAVIADALPALQKKLDALMVQFQGGPPPPFTATAATASSPFSPSASTSSASLKPSKKAVRFQDKPLPVPKDSPALSAIDLEAQRAGLFNRPYRDDDDDSPNNVDRSADNSQLLQTHARIIANQDAQLDALGASISRQRELSMQIGDELDSHVVMLEESERLTDHHQSRIDRARHQVGRIARSASDCKQMVVIVVLIVILVLLIAILK